MNRKSDQSLKCITRSATATARPTARARPIPILETMTAKDLTTKRSFAVHILPMFSIRRLWMQSQEPNIPGRLDLSAKVSCGRSWIPQNLNPSSTFTILQSSMRNTEGSKLILKQRRRGIVINSVLEVDLNEGTKCEWKRRIVCYRIKRKRIKRKKNIFYMNKSA